MSGIGSIYLGMPKGFNRTGDKDCPVQIYTSLQAAKEESSNVFGKFTVSVWKHLNKAGHTLVRVYCPRINTSHIMIFLENCMDQIQAIEISEQDIKGMD